ncbi:MAG: hypothetical protein A2076_06585 [Geobacteraceae bacterium GWC2_53_11]|nr:MAG: hypothetical protein A2076_06585 [Geobacteraceae bacterium GWC2_53_11]
MANLAEGGITITSNCKNLFIDLKEKILNNPDFSYESGPSFSGGDAGSMDICFYGRWSCCFAFEYIDSLIADEQYIYRQDLIDAEISGWQEEFSNFVFAWYRKAPGEVTITELDPYEVLGLDSDDDFWGAMGLIVPKLPELGETLEFSVDFRINVISKNEISHQLTRYALIINYVDYDIECTFTCDEDGEIDGESFAERYAEKWRDEHYKMYTEMCKSNPRPGYYEEMEKYYYMTYYGVEHDIEQSNAVRQLIRPILYEFFHNE